MGQNPEVTLRMCDPLRSRRYRWINELKNAFPLARKIYEFEIGEVVRSLIAD